MPSPPADGTASVTMVWQTFYTCPAPVPIWAFPLALVSLFCWGSWSNTAKEAGLRGVPFAHFYTDWACSCVLTALAAWVTLGAG
eukprot:SAG31_NODE_22986_length_513_cov_4.729469_1_plen_83_part_10